MPLLQKNSSWRNKGQEKKYSKWNFKIPHIFTYMIIKSFYFLWILSVNTYVMTNQSWRRGIMHLFVVFIESYALSRWKTEMVVIFVFLVWTIFRKMWYYYSPWTTRSMQAPSSDMQICNLCTSELGGIVISTYIYF